MAETLSTDFVFEPKVWSDHLKAFFDEKLVYGSFALKNYDLKEEGTGLTVNFPYFKSIGDAEEPLETDDLTIDNLSDDSFSCSIFEVGKAVGISKKAFKKSAAHVDQIVEEAHMQMAQRHAKKVDQKLNTEITTPANYVMTKTGVDGERLSVKELFKSKVRAFGDKSDETEVCFMHSLSWMDLMSDDSAGFLKADASDPLNAIKGFKGTMLNGTAVIVADSCVKNLNGQVATKDTYLTHFHKKNSFGIMEKQDVEFDSDKDILGRKEVFTSNQWYGVKSFHGKVSPEDKKAGAMVMQVSE